MKKIYYITFLNSFLFINFNIFAVQFEFDMMYSASNIASIQSIIKIMLECESPKNIIAAIDFDETISAKNGKTAPLREGEATKNFIYFLQEQGLTPLVITSRIHGKSLSSAQDKANIYNCIQKTIHANQQHRLRLKDVPALKTSEYQEYNLKIYKPPHDAVFPTNVMTCDQFVFAGSHKGAALIYLIDNKHFTQQPDIIIFLDDSLENVKDVRDKFEDRSEKVLLIHYPNDIY